MTPASHGSRSRHGRNAENGPRSPQEAAFPERHPCSAHDCSPSGRTNLVRASSSSSIVSGSADNAAITASPIEPCTSPLIVLAAVTMFSRMRLIVALQHILEPGRYRSRYRPALPLGAPRALGVPPGVLGIVQTRLRRSQAL